MTTTQSVDFDYFVEKLEQLKEARSKCRSLTLRDELISKAVRKDGRQKNNDDSNLLFPPSVLSKTLNLNKVKDVLNCPCQVCRSIKGHGSDILTDNVLVNAVTKEDGKDMRLRFAALIYIGACFAVRHVCSFRIRGFETQTMMDLLKRELFAPLSSALPDIYSNVNDLAGQFKSIYYASYEMMDSPEIELANEVYNFTGTNLPFLFDEEMKDARSSYGKVYTFELHPDFAGRNWKETNTSLKLVRKELQWDETETEERQTLQFISQCGQPNLVRLLFWYRYDDKVNYVFRRYPATLFSILQANSNHIHPREITSYKNSRLQHWMWQGMVDVIRALEFFHFPKQDQIKGQLIAAHFDLKPANILVDNDGTFVVTDFGLAQIKAVEPDGLTTITAKGHGTFAYSAPPSVSPYSDRKSSSTGSNDDDKKRSRAYDVWSMACIMTEVIDYILHSDIDPLCFQRFCEQRQADDIGPSLGHNFWIARGQQYQLKPSVYRKLAEFRLLRDPYLATVTELLERMFSIDPLERPQMSECLSVISHNVASDDWPLLDVDEKSILGLGTRWQLRQMLTLFKRTKVNELEQRCKMYFLYNESAVKVRLAVEFDKDGNTFVVSDSALYKTERVKPLSHFQQYLPRHPCYCSFKFMHSNLQFTFERSNEYLHFLTAVTRQKILRPLDDHLREAHVSQQDGTQMLKGRFPIRSCVIKPKTKRPLFRDHNERYGIGYIQILKELSKEDYETDFILSSTMAASTSPGLATIRTFDSVLHPPATQSSGSSPRRESVASTTASRITHRLAVYLFGNLEQAPQCFTINLTSGFNEIHLNRDGKRFKSDTKVTIHQLRDNLSIAKFVEEDKSCPAFPLDPEELDDYERSGFGIDYMELNFENKNVALAFGKMMAFLLQGHGTVIL